MDYQTASDFLASGRNKSDRPYANNTRIVRLAADKIGVKLHSTYVVILYADGRVELQSGGWRTPTTKERMARFVPRIYQDRGEWYVPYGDRTHIYADGITLHPDGSVTGAGTADAVKETRALRRKVSKYAKDFTAALLAGDVPAPSGGDCWVCAVNSPDPGGESHIRSHLEESYFVPRLLYNALEKRSSPMAKHAVGMLWRGEDIGNLRWIVESQVRKDIRRYVLESLELAS